MKKNEKEATYIYKFKRKLFIIGSIYDVLDEVTSETADYLYNIIRKHSSNIDSGIIDYDIIYEDNCNKYKELHLLFTITLNARCDGIDKISFGKSIEYMGQEKR